MQAHLHDLQIRVSWRYSGAVVTQRQLPPITMSTIMPAYTIQVGCSDSELPIGLSLG